MFTSLIPLLLLSFFSYIDLIVTRKIKWVPELENEGSTLAVWSPTVCPQVPFVSESRMGAGSSIPSG